MNLIKRLAKFFNGPGIKNRIESIGYLLAMWLCLSAGASIILDSIDKGTAVVSALTLYFILQAKQKEEMYLKHMAYLASIQGENSNA